MYTMLKATATLSSLVQTATAHGEWQRYRPSSTHMFV